MTTLSTHVLDVERGMPAAGVPVALYQAERLLAEARTNGDGRIAHLASLEGGVYRIAFDAAGIWGAGKSETQTTIYADLYEAYVLPSS